MLDSGCTSHMTPHKNCVHKAEKCHHKVNLADDSCVSAKEKGVRTVKWQTSDGVYDVHLSKTLVVPDLTMSQLSVPALVRKNIRVIILPGKTMLIDLEDDFMVLGQAYQDRDGLFYIHGDESNPRPNRMNDNRVTAMVAIMNEHFRRDETKTNGQTHHSESENEAAYDDEEKTDRAKNTQLTKGQEKLADMWHLRLGHALPKKAVV